MGDWVGVAIVLGAAFTLFILKFIFIRCFFKSNRTRNDLGWLQSHSPPARNYFQGSHMYFYPDHVIPASDFGPAHIPPELAGCFGRVKQKPPPSFEKALKCSTPVKLVNQVIVEVDEDENEEPPPTYEECQVKASCSAGAASTTAIAVASTSAAGIQSCHQQPPPVGPAPMPVPVITRAIVTSEV